MVSSEMPKFIWVCEVSTSMHFECGKVDGIMVLDATDASISEGNKLIIGILGGQAILKAGKIPITSGAFSSYSGNLTEF
jgi:hypothetical protein